MADTWTIHDKDGGYLGKSRAMSAKVAFIVYLSEMGEIANLADVQAERLPDGRTRIIHGDTIRYLTRVDE